MSWLFYLIIIGIVVYALRVMRKKKLEQLDLPRSYAGNNVIRHRISNKLFFNDNNEVIPFVALL